MNQGSADHRQAERGEKPHEWVTVMPRNADKSDTPSLARGSANTGCRSQSNASVRKFARFFIWAGSAPVFIFRKGGMNMTEKTPELTEEEKKILKLIQTIGFGKVVVTVKNGKPVFVETQKTIQLSER